MNIVLCMDSNYVMPSLVCMTSILENNTGSIDFYIIYSQLEIKEIKFIEEKIRKYGDQFTLRTIKIADDTFSDLPIYGRSKAAYFRLLIPTLLPQNIDRCLYLDGDTIIYKPLEEFYNTSFDEKAFVVNEDMGETILYHKERHPILNIPVEYKYFNSGVLIFNLESFRKNYDMKNTFDWIKNNPDKLKFLDQDVLNAVFYDKVKYVDGYMHDYLEILISPLLPNDNMCKATIVHFIKKPWKYDYNGINAKYWWKYGKMIYRFEYIKFSIVNFVFRKSLGLLMLIVPISTLKKIKNK